MLSPVGTVISSRSELTQSMEEESGSVESSRWTVEHVRSWGELVIPVALAGQQSTIWSSFGLKPDPDGRVDPRFETRAICKLCLEKGQLVIISRAGAQTSSMRDHYSRKHEAPTEKTERLQVKGHGKTKSITGYFLPSVANNFNVAKEAIARWVAITKQPFSVVEDESFRTMLLTIANNTKGFSESHIPKKDCITEYVEVKSALIHKWMSKKLSQWKWFSVTADVWKSSNLEHFMGLTVHSVNETTGDIDALKLDVSSFRGRHDAESIATFLRARLDAFNIDMRKIVMLTTDTTAAMVAAFKQSEDGSRDYCDVPHFNCVAHVLDLCMKGLKEHPLTKPTIKKLLRFISMVRKSSTITRALEEACVDAGKEITTLRGFVDIRWGSVRFALQQVLLLESEIRKVKPINKTKVYWPDDDDWLMYVGLEYLLSAIHEAQQRVSGEKYVVISTVPSTLKSIKQKLNQLRHMDLFSIDNEDLSAVSTLIDFEVPETTEGEEIESEEDDAADTIPPPFVDSTGMTWAATTKLALTLKWLTEFYSLRCLEGSLPTAVHVASLLDPRGFFYGEEISGLTKAEINSAVDMIVREGVALSRMKSSKDPSDNDAHKKDDIHTGS
jgi:hypothetical protein